MSIPGSASPLFFTAAADAAAAGPVKSVRFNSGDSAYLNRTPSSAGSNTTWTISTWMKKTGKDNHIFGAGAGNNPGRFGLTFDNDDKISVFVVDSNNVVYLQNSDAVFRDPSAWYHFVVVADTTNSTAADRLIIYVNGVRQSLSGGAMPLNQNTFVNTTAAHAIGRRSYTTSDYFDGYLADTYLIDGTAKDATDFGAFDDNGVWQAAAYSGTFGTNGFHLFDFASESGIGDDSSGNDNDFTVNNIADSAISYGTTTNSSQTNANTYIVSDTRWSFNTGYPGEQAFDGSTSTIGTFGQVYFYAENGYSKPTVTNSSGGVEVMAAGNGITAAINEGTQVTCANGSFTKISGTFDGTLNSINVYGNTTGASYFYAVKVNGVHIAVRLRTESPEDLDVLRDVPTNGDSSDDTGAGGEVSANYCTLNPLDKATVAVLSDGNLRTNSSGAGAIRGTFKYPKTGKWYYEVQPIDDAQYNTGYFHVGIATADSNLNASPGYDTTNEFTYWQNGSKTNNVAYGASFTAGDIIGVAFDAGAGSLTFYKNGVSQGVNSTGLTGEYFPYAPTWNYNAAYNFGQRSFAYPVSNYLPLSTTNLPTPTIADGSDYFQAKTFTGNGGTQSVSNLKFSPDFLWFKNRTDTSAAAHRLFDTVRGASKTLFSNLTNEELEVANSLTSFDSNGFTVGSGNWVNGSGDGIIAWAWDAGSSTVSNTDGSITSSVRANQTAGFSIVTYSGTDTGSSQTIGHGLNAAPKLWMFKNRSAAGDWIVYTTAIDGGSDYAKLNATDAFAAGVSPWSTAPTSSVVTVGTNNVDTCNAGDNYLLLAFTPVAGYSAFGSYTGDAGSSNFVHLGFRPRLLIIKRSSDGSNGWHMADTARSPENVANEYLYADTSGAEETNGSIDILSNGFCLKANAQTTNNSGVTYIYMAWASNPFQANGGLAR